VGRIVPDQDKTRGGRKPFGHARRHPAKDGAAVLAGVWHGSVAVRRDSTALRGVVLHTC